MTQKARTRVLITDPLAEEGVARLREQHEVDTRYGLSAAEVEALIPEYDALVVRSGTKVTSRIIEAGSRLKVIGRAGSGLDNIDVSTARAVGVEVLNCPGANSVAVAEHTMGLILALARHIPQADQSMKAGKWEKSRFKGKGLQGRTLGILGFGRIGREVAHRAQGLGMRILVNQPRLTPELALEANVLVRDLPDLLREADIVTLHVPMRAENRGLIGAAELALMKPSAFLINTARGGIVDEEALLEALNQGKLAGAGIDVFEQEPPTDTRLAQHPRVVATPHIAASTDEAQINAALSIAEQINQYLEAEGSVAASLSLQMVPTELVIPHEATDPKRVMRLAAAIEEDGLLVNPPVVAEYEGKFIVLDGATRTTAFLQMGIPHLVVQLTDPFGKDVELHTWYHVVSGSDPDALLRELQQIPSLQLSALGAAEVHEALRGGNALATISLADGRVFRADLAGEGADRIDVLNHMVARYTLWGDVARTLTSDLEQLRTTYEEIAALIVFPQFQPEDALQAAIQGKTLPQGITRFIIPGACCA